MSDGNRNPASMILDYDDAATTLNYLADRYGSGLVLAYDDCEWALYPHGLEGERFVAPTLADLLVTAANYDLG